jgi:uncharacterized protein
VKPDDVFARDVEWSELDRHVTDGRARLGVVTGRRRVGKTFLLRRLVRKHGGMMVSCLQEERRPALQRFADALGEVHGVRLGPPDDWVAALTQATKGPLAVPLLVIDEFPYLSDHSPEIESALQHVVDASRESGGTRIILAGSSLSVMGGLLDGPRPLRGRADLQLRLRPFDYRTAAAFWGVDDPSLAFRLHAVVGGSPGYRSLATRGPDTLVEFDDWVESTLFNTASALNREDEYLLAEDRRIGDKAIYGSVLRAVAQGEHRPSRIGGRLGRPQTSLSHVLSVLIESDFLRNETGLLSSRDPLYRVSDEIVQFHRSCVEPWRPMIEDQRPADAWRSAQPAWHASVLGPHLERIVRTWAARFGEPTTLGGPPGLVGRAEVPDPVAKVAREVDLVVLAPSSRPGPNAQVQCLGEVKLQADLGALAQLDRCRDLVEQRGHGRAARLVLVAETFTDDLRAAAKTRRDLTLVSLANLYDLPGPTPSKRKTTSQGSRRR